jgi:hypothetical protein
LHSILEATTGAAKTRPIQRKQWPFCIVPQANMGRYKFIETTIIVLFFITNVKEMYKQSSIIIIK